MNGKPAGFNPASVLLTGFIVLDLLVAGLVSCGDENGKVKSAPRLPENNAVFKSPTSTVLTSQNSVRLVRMTLEDTLEVPVRIELDERRSVLITSPAAGRLEEVFIRSADQAVKAGEPIATLFSPELVTAQREYLLVYQGTNAPLLKDAASRLVQMGMTSGQIQAIRRTGKPLERIPIPSPKAGFVAPTMATPTAASSPGGMGAPASGGGSMGGMGGGGGTGTGTSGKSSGSGTGDEYGSSALTAGTYVERGTPLAALNDKAIVAAVLALPIDQAGIFRQGDSTHLSIPSVGLSAMARLDYLESRVSDTNRTLTAKAYIPNPDLNLKVGALGEAHLAATLDSIWVLPRTATHFLGEKWMVWLRSTADTSAFQAREVRLGRLGRRFVEIVRGLSPGDAVAENASLLVDPDAVITLQALPDSTAETAPFLHPETPAANPESTDHASHGPAASVLSISGEEEVLAGIRMEQARMAMLTPSTIFRATTRFDDRSSESVPTRVEGAVEQVRIRRPGERVVKGQVLAEIRSDALLAAQQEFLLALSQSKTLPDKAMARSQGQAARRRLTVLGMTGSGVDALVREGKTTSRLPIASPISGIVLEVKVQAGQYVQEGAALFSVGGGERIWVETWLLPGELATYPEGSEAWVEIEGRQGDPIQGRLEHATQETRVSGGLTVVHVGIPNPEGEILPGVQAWVTLKENGRQALAIPASALIESSHSIMAWVRVAPNRYAPRMVKVGLRTPAAVEVLEGIRGGEEVVASGAYLLNSEWIIRQGAARGHAGH